jgi:autotransporter passenger strand-loop-strand repeat protein
MATIVSSGQSSTVSGSVSGVIVDGELIVASGGRALDTTVSSGGTLVVSSGGTARFTVLSAGATLTVASGGLIVSTIDGAALTLSSGIVGSFTQVVSGGTEQVAGGVAIGTVVSGGGSEIVVSAGIARFAVISSGGEQIVSSGGVVSDTVVNSSGTEIIGNGGSALSTFVGVSATLEVSAGGAATDAVVVSGGEVFVASGGAASGLVVSEGGAAFIASGGTASGAVVSSGGIIALDLTSSAANPGLLDGVTLESGAIVELTISSGASVSGLAINSGGFVDVLSGGSAANTIVASGGTFEIFSGAATTGTILASGGVIDLENVSGTSASWSAGVLTVSSGGAAVFSMSLPGNFATATFLVSGDGGSGTDISVASGGSPFVPQVFGPASAALNDAQHTAISGVSLAEANSFASATFTVTLTDSDGLLFASGKDVTGIGTTSLTVAGTLSQVNAALKTLVDIDAIPPTDAITIAATDSLGDIAAPQTIAVTVKPEAPTLAVQKAVTVGAGQPTPVLGVNLAEVGAFASEGFTVMLSDSHGALAASAASGAAIAGSGTTSLTISGALSAVDAALATLTDTESAAGRDTITVTAVDAFGRSVGAKTKVTVNGAPAVTVPATLALTAGKAGKIAGAAVKESGHTAGETFTLTLSDANGLLSATGPGVVDSGTTSLTILGSLSRVNADLKSLKDSDPTAGTETIQVTATDSFGNGTTKPIIVTIAASQGRAVPIYPGSLLGRTARFLGGSRHGGAAASHAPGWLSEAKHATPPSGEPLGGHGVPATGDRHLIFAPSGVERELPLFVPGDPTAQ